MVIRAAVATIALAVAATSLAEPASAHVPLPLPVAVDVAPLVEPALEGIDAPAPPVLDITSAPPPVPGPRLQAPTIHASSLGAVALLGSAASLYLRVGRPDVLAHKEREKLHRAVEARPGVHFHALQRDLGWNVGTLTYHLRVLERHGFLVSRRDGPYRRLYVQGAAPPKEAFPTDALRGLRADVLNAVRGRPGISQTDLAAALRARKQTVNYHVKALERAEALRVEKRGRETFLHPEGDA